MKTMQKFVFFFMLACASFSVKAQQQICTGATKTYAVNVGDPSHAGSTYAWSISPSAGTPDLSTMNTNSISVNWNTAAAGIYTINVIETSAAGCPAAAQALTVTLVPPPAAPTLNITQPTCSVATATIEVTAPVGAGLEYSLDGVVWQASTTFTGIASGAVNVYVKNGTGCPGPATAGTVNVQPATLTTSAISFD